MAGELVTGYVRLVPTVVGIQGATAKALAPAEREAAVAGRRAGGAFGLSMKKVIGIAAGFLAVKSLTGFAHSSADAFVDLNKQVVQLRRTTGGSIKGVSALRGAIQLSGADVDKTAGALKIFSKNLKTAAGDQKKSAALQKLLGTSFKDSKGNVEDFTTLLPRVSDQFAHMADGPNKTALALKLFGRSGADLLPFLNKGSGGIKELEKQAAKLGITLDDTSNKKFTAFREEERRSQAAMMGLKVTIGGVLLPVFTSFSTFLTGRMIPAFSKVIDYLRTSPRVQGFVDGITDTFDRMGTAVDGALKKLGSLNVNNIDGNKLGHTLAAAIGVALDSLGSLSKKLYDKLSKILGKVDWVGLGISIGKEAPAFALGLAAGLLNLDFDSLISGIGKHWLDVLIGVLTLAFLPSKVIRPFAEILGRIPFAGKFIEAFIKGLNAKGGELLSFVGRFFGDLGRAFLEGFGKINLPGAGLITRILGFFGGLPGAIVRFFVGIGETFYLKSLMAAERVGEGLRGAFGSILSAAGKIPGLIIRGVGKLLSILAAPGRQAVDGLLSALRSRFPNVTKFVGTFASKIKSSIKGAPTLLKSIGSSIIDGLVSGIKGAWHKVTDYLSSKIRGLSGVAKKLLGINSPSKVFAEIGVGIPEGMVVGIKRGHPAVDRAVGLLGAPGIISGGPAAALRKSVAASSDSIGSNNDSERTPVYLDGVVVGYLRKIAGEIVIEKIDEYDSQAAMDSRF